MADGEPLRLLLRRRFRCSAAAVKQLPRSSCLSAGFRLLGSPPSWALAVAASVAPAAASRTARWLA
jgi:hypothetical protein